MNLATDEAHEGMQVIVVDIVSHLPQGSTIDGIPYHSHAPFFLLLNGTDVVIEQEPTVCILQTPMPTASLLLAEARAVLSFPAMTPQYKSF